jgi:ketosteroid isomerase-like protein
VAAFSNGDAAARAALYAEDGQVLPPNSDFVVGRPPIQAFWQAVIDMGVKGARLDIVEVEGHGHTAIEISKFALVGARR